MNNYHLYEEIGHGKFSMVYKGRKKHTIRYVAVKSIEKNRREKVMVEVGVLSRLDHPNVVGFVAWYETRNHLWIIFEYCAGGDVLRLLRQDGRLPEDVVRRFGIDVCSGLLHVHSRRIIYSDLKPANVLFSEDGTLKLSEFGHSQKLEDIADALQEGIQVPRRGTPHYMAPELFQEGGMHSFASDFWALGCVLHEMISGRPPFQSSSFAKLQSIVLLDPTPPVASASAEFQTLLVWLLRKDPLLRAEWRDIRPHGFWLGQAIGHEADATALPAQPHLDELRCLWKKVADSISSVDDMDAAAVAPETDVAARQQRKTSEAAVDATATQPQRRPDVANVRLSYTLGQAGGQGAMDAEPSIAPLAPSLGADVLHAAQSTPTKAAHQNQQGGGLRALLGDTVYERTREVLDVVSDGGVRPIARNPQIEEPEPLDVTGDLPFAALRLEEVCSRPHADLEAFLTKVYRCIAQGTQDQKVGALKYLEQICCHMQVADVVVNSSLLRLVLRMLLARAKNSSGTASGVAAAPLVLRVRLISLIGQLLRHATYLEPSIAELGLVDGLLEGLNKGGDLTVRRRAAAAMGELLFYVGSQPDNPSGTTGVGGAPGIDAWRLSTSTIRAFSDLLLSANEDEVVRHCAAKTVENVASQCPAMAQRWFYSPELLHALAGHSRRSSSDAFRLSCIGALAHVLRCRPESTSLEKPWAEGELVTLAIAHLAPQGIPYGLQLLATTLLEAPKPDDLDATLPRDAVNLLIGVLAQPRYSGALRGRVCVLLTLLFAADDAREAKRLRLAIDKSFVSLVDRLGRDKDPFVSQCVAAAASVMEAVVVEILQSVYEAVRQLAAGTSGAQDVVGGLVQVLPVLLHLLSSAALCGCVFDARALPVLGSICEIVARSSVSVPANVGGTMFYQLQPLVLMIMEALGTQQAFLLEHAPQVVRCVLPALAACLSSSRADVRLLALKAFSAACIVLLNDGHVFDPTVAKPTETTLLLEALFGNRALPMLPRLFGDDAPAPSCALRLLAALLSRNSGAASVAVRDPGLLHPMLTALRGQQALSLHTALLVQCLLRAHAVHLHELSDAGVFTTVHAALRDAADVAAGHSAQMDFAMVDAALCVAADTFSQCLALLTQPQRQQQQPVVILAELGPLGQLFPILAMLCLALATTGFLPLLDRAAECCQHLADLARAGGPHGRRLIPDASARDVGLLLDALLAASRWRQATDDDAALARACAADGGGATAATGANALGSVQRRLLVVLEWAVATGVGVEVRAEVAAGVERLLRDRLLGDDPALTAEARRLIAGVISRGVGVG